jgi:hypothetical protein
MLELQSTMAGEVSSPELEIEVATVDGSSLWVKEKREELQEVLTVGYSRRRSGCDGPTMKRNNGGGRSSTATRLERGKGNVGARTIAA